MTPIFTKTLFIVFVTFAAHRVHPPFAALGASFALVLLLALQHTLARHFTVDPTWSHAVRDAARALNLATPSARVVDTWRPVALALGATASTSVLVLSRSLTLLLDPIEQRAVAAHLLARVRRGDTLRATVVFALPEALLLRVPALGRWAENLALASARDQYADTVAARIVGSAAVVARVLRKLRSYAEFCEPVSHPGRAAFFLAPGAFSSVTDDLGYELRVGSLEDRDAVHRPSAPAARASFGSLSTQ